MRESEAVKFHAVNVVAGLNEFLPARGFASPDRTQRLGKYSMGFWRRDVEWKVDVVQFSYHAANAFYFVASLSVYVPDAEQSGERLFDGKGVDYLLDRSGGYNLPSFFGRTVAWRSESFARKICRDTEKALGWFDNFETPEKCLTQLATGKTNGAGPPGSKAYLTKKTIAPPASS